MRNVSIDVASARQTLVCIGVVDSGRAFDAWMQRAAVAETSERNAELVRWATAPSARAAHPREEHLLPLMVMAGAAGEDRGQIAFHDKFGGFHITAAHFGA